MDNFVAVWSGISGMQLGATLTWLTPANSIGLFQVNVPVGTNANLATATVGDAPVPDAPEPPAAAVVTREAVDVVTPAAVVLEAAPAAVTDPVAASAAAAAAVTDPVVAAVAIDPAAPVSMAAKQPHRLQTLAP